MSQSLQSGDTTREAVADLIAAGRTRQRRLPGKHGDQPRSYGIVAVLLRDEPGQLARLFTDTAAADVNIEDVRVEHAPGLPFGLIELFVGPESTEVLHAALSERGWRLMPDG